MCSYGCRCLCGCIANTHVHLVGMCVHVEVRGQILMFFVFLFVFSYFGSKSSVIVLLRISYCCEETLTMVTLIKKTFN